MARIISASIDLNKIDKSRIIPGKNGAKYYNIDVILNDSPNQYGQDVSITTAQSKEERAAKAPKVYLGNGKTAWKSMEADFAQPVSQQHETHVSDGPKNDLPF